MIFGEKGKKEIELLFTWRSKSLPLDYLRKCTDLKKRDNKTFKTVLLYSIQVIASKRLLAEL